MIIQCNVFPLEEDLVSQRFVSHRLHSASCFYLTIFRQLCSVVSLVALAITIVWKNRSLSPTGWSLGSFSSYIYDQLRTRTFPLETRGLSDL